MQNGALAYQQVAQKTATPRDLEAQLLLRAAARLSACNDTEEMDRSALREALEFNRKLWTLFLSSVNRPENPLPDETKGSVRRLAIFVMERCIRLEIAPARTELEHLISINRDIAGGLFGRA
jgi:flagellar biosynthesis activator protein FlaF